jgi:hypothetical protein
MRQVINRKQRRKFLRERGILKGKNALPLFPIQNTEEVKIGRFDHIRDNQERGREMYLKNLNYQATAISEYIVAKEQEMRESFGDSGFNREETDIIMNKWGETVKLWPAAQADELL